jgi:hypothetical protein
VADSKLCNADAMQHIDSRGGRFLTVLPRSRSEDRYFREWIQSNQPQWHLVRNGANPRRRGGPRDRWWTFRDPLPSRETWPVVWLYGSLLRRHQELSRQERIRHVVAQLQALNAKLTGPRPRRRSRQDLQLTVERILKKRHVSR